MRTVFRRQLVRHAKFFLLAFVFKPGLVGTTTQARITNDVGYADLERMCQDDPQEEA